jgi:BMFP domain-containing protein YqiC
MKNIQEVFDRIEQTRHEQWLIKAMQKDSLDNSKEYQEIVDKLKKLKIQKKEIEDQINADLGKEWEKLDLLKLHLREDKEMLADIAISTLMKGETVKVTDKNKADYEPVFSVRFRKANEVRKED